MADASADDRATCDYVIVGSGAGGGPLAARLAEAGMEVVLLEAGGDPRTAGGDRFPGDYDVPAFHPFASENPAMAWNYHVDHYDDPAQAARDWKRQPDGVLYPRAGTLGGCTSHNAMIFVAPQDSDWDGIAALTGEAGWSAAAMRTYRRRVERCRHRPLHRWLAKFGLDRSGHGYRGWLPVEVAMPGNVFADHPLIALMRGGAAAALAGIPDALDALRDEAVSAGDPNDARVGGDEAVCYVPVATDRHCRYGARDRVLAAAGTGRLRVVLDALATRLLFEGDRAVGVEYLKGAKLYRAHCQPSDLPGETRTIRARREVILAAGAFNTPQLLMLSGIGDPAEIARHGIAARVDLPGVGRNLQDRYEVAVLFRMAAPWAALTGARYDATDPIAQAWAGGRSGMYISNGAALAVTRRSKPTLAEADLFLMALIGRFDGYYPGYSRALAEASDMLSWAVLKARTANRAGRVTLRSADPRDMPHIAFRYFAEGGEADLDAVVAGVRMARAAAAPLIATGVIAGEIAPGPAVTGDALATWVRDNAWGHHASCSCPIGARDAGGVVDARPPAAAIVQWLVNVRRRDDGLAIAEERVPPGEQAEIDAVIATMRAHLVQDYAPGKMERAGNTKTHALVRGELIVHDGLAATLRHGLFASPGRYPAWVRFAGPGPHVEPDIEDVGFLSFGMKVMGVEGEKLMDDEAHTQDFLAVCTPTFTSADLHANVSLQKWSKRELGLWYFLNPFDHHLCDGLMQGLWTKTQGNPLGEPYYSTVAYLLGEGQAMQYRFRPLTKVPAHVPRLPLRPPDDYLRETMVRTLAETDVEFELSVQLQTGPHRMPIETAAVIWPERLSPHVPVATLRIPKQRFDSPAQLAFARVLSFNPWHSLAAHRPLGNLGRARRKLYRELAEFRQRSNGVAHVEPTGEEQFGPDGISQPRLG